MRSGQYGSTITAYDYYGITMMVFGALNTATLAANSIMENRILTANIRLCNAPIPSFFVHLPKVIASFIFGVICHTIVGVALHLLVGVNFGGNNAGYLWLLLIAVDLFAASFSVMLCCLLKSEETVNQLLSIIVTISCLLGGAFFSMKGFGSVMDIISGISPITWINSAAFQAIYDSNFSLLGYVIGGLLVLSMV